jgi:hypothetical protein
VLSTGPVGLRGWVVLSLLALSVFAAMEIYKVARRGGMRRARNGFKG